LDDLFVSESRNAGLPFAVPGKLLGRRLEDFWAENPVWFGGIELTAIESED